MDAYNEDINLRIKELLEYYRFNKSSFKDDFVLGYSIVFADHSFIADYTVKKLGFIKSFINISYRGNR